MKLVNIHNKKRIIYKFLRDDDGNQIIEEDETFYPYWYEKIGEGQEAKYVGYDGAKLLKRYASDPREVKKCKTQDSYEADVSYKIRYMVDRVAIIDKAPFR